MKARHNEECTGKLKNPSNKNNTHQDQVVWLQAPRVSRLKGRPDFTRVRQQHAECAECAMSLRKNKPPFWNRN